MADDNRLYLVVFLTQDWNMVYSGHAVIRAHDCDVARQKAVDKISAEKGEDMSWLLNCSDIITQEITDA